MIRKQKVYEVGTLVSHRTSEYDAFLEQCEVPWENGIIIDRYKRSGVDHPIELLYLIRWNGGVIFKVFAKELKGMVKSGRIKILSEG
tara:strand:- start:100 stop:360 length:261 start_codon:yes stop_codon:yes gene_type:complete